MPCGNVSGYSIPQKGGDVNAESDFSTCLGMHKANWVDGGHRGIYCSDDSDCNYVNNRKEVCNMNTNLQVVEANHQRVLTTAQIAEQYGTDAKAISKNFTRNKERYTEGKHYYCLTGDAKREFLNRYQIDDGLRATVFYLWTEKGALLHAKSLNTDQAWQAYEVLVDTYFSVREQAAMDSYMIADPVKRAERWIEEQREKQQLETTVAAQSKQMEQDKPKVLFADSVAASSSSILIGELAKLIKQNGVDMGQRRLFAWMRENGYLIKRCGSEYNLPTQRSMERGLMEIKETSVIHSGYTTISKTPKVTGKGQVYFINLLVGQREAVTE